jgi:hypothetical protein
MRVSNARKGFFEEPEFRVLLKNLNPWMQLRSSFAYLSDRMASQERDIDSSMAAG